MSKPSRRAVGLIGSLSIAALLLPASQAGAQCRNVWAPSPEGGQLILICDGNTGSGGGGGGKAKGKKKEKKRKPQFGAIAQNPVPTDPVEGIYSGATSAGYTSKRKARNRALRACARSTGGECDLMATTKRNGWAVLVGALGPGGLPWFFSGTGKTHTAAQREAERRAEEGLGSSRTGPTQLVVGVDGRAKRD